MIVGFLHLSGEGAISVPFAISELLGSPVLATLQLVETIGTDIDPLLAMIPVGVAEEPPADETDHDGNGRYEDANGCTRSGDVDFGRRVSAWDGSVGVVFAEARDCVWSR